jgi:hypothetical protein
MYRAIEKLVALDKRRGVPLRQSYIRVAKQTSIMVGRYSHAHQFKRARRMLKFLRTRLGRLIRDIGRKIEGDGELEALFIPLLGLASCARYQDRHLRNGGDASRIKGGRWHQVIDWVIQICGYPPSMQFVEYAKVVSVSGKMVTLDRPLRHGYDQTWWEDPADDQSLGVVRLCPMTRVGRAATFRATGASSFAPGC